MNRLRPKMLQRRWLLLAAMLSVPSLLVGALLCAHFAPPLVGLFFGIGTIGVALTLALALIQQRRQAAHIHYQLLAEHTHDLLLFIRAADGRILDANAAAVRAYGYPRAQLLSLTISDLRASETVGAIHTQMQQADQGGINFESLHRRADDSCFPVEVHSVGANLGAERVLLSIVRDISARRALEHSLDAERQFMASVLETTGALVTVLDPAGRIIHFNRACQELTGYSLAEARGRPFWELVLSASEAATLQAYFPLSNAASLPTYRENPWRARDGRLTPIAWNNTVVVDAHGRPLTLIACGINLSERVAAEQMLRATNRTLRIRDAFHYGLAEADGEAALFQMVCAALVEHGGYAVSWVSLRAPADHSQALSLAALAGPLAHLAPQLAGAWAAPEQPQGSPAGSMTYTLSPPDREAPGEAHSQDGAAWAAGLRVVTSMPLLLEGRVIGALGVGTSAPEALEASESAMLESLVGDLAYGAGVFRARAAQQRAEATLRQVLYDLEQRVEQRTAELALTNQRLGEELVERQQAEATLREREQFIQHIAAAIPGMLYLYDLETRKNVYLNEGLSAILGYTPAEVGALGDMIFTRLMHPEDRAQVATAQERLRTGLDGEVIGYEYRLRHINGSWRWLAGRDTIFSRLPDGCVGQILGTAVDITARHEAELALSASNLRLQTAVRALERRTGELATLSELSEALQHCASFAEAYGVIAQVARALFPDTSGIVSMRRADNGLLEPVAIWGEFAMPPQAFSPEACWALRAGTLHVYDPTRITPPCAHFSLGPEDLSICVPLPVEGRAPGLVQLWLPHAERSDLVAWAEQLRAWEQLASALSDHVSLALTGLQLRTERLQLEDLATASPISTSL